ncbi:hypothetical protein CLOM_g3001, partial [Closterium sp. NIES-68]
LRFLTRALVYPSAFVLSSVLLPLLVGAPPLAPGWRSSSRSWLAFLLPPFLLAFLLPAKVPASPFRTCNASDLGASALPPFRLASLPPRHSFWLASAPLPSPPRGPLAP